MAHKCAIRMAGSNDRCIQPSRQSADLGELAAGSSGGLERAVGRGQGAVGVLAEILVARRVEQVEGEPLMLKARARPPSNPSASAAARRAPSLRPPIGSPAKQQQFLGQRRLAGIWVRNDRKRPPAQNLVGQGTHRAT
jgi:hypothetical protein